MHVLISPNSFKHSIDAASAAEAIRSGWLSARPADTAVCAPVGDGGDGTGPLLTAAHSGITRFHSVHDPLGRKIDAPYGWIGQETAVIEMAAASGLRLLADNERDPLRASSIGTGELIAHALDNGATRIALCVGGSATVDGGCGILHALGVRFLDSNGDRFIPLPRALPQLASIDTSGLHPAWRSCEITILCDVNNPLLGDRGAARVFGPQKGASPAQVEALESYLSHLQHIILQTTGTDISSLPHGGAAGGVVAGLCALGAAKAVNGIEHFLDSISFNAQLQPAQLVITGEGSIDRQTLEGKAPYGVAVRAKARQVPVAAMCGKVSDIDLLSNTFQHIIPINPEGMDLQQALDSAAQNLEHAARKLALSLR